MTYKEAVTKAYGIAYINRSKLCQILIDADEERASTSDDDNYYFCFTYNGSSGSRAILKCAQKYGGIERIIPLFKEDGSINYRIWISKKAPFDIVHFVCALVYGAGAITILGVPLSHAVEYIFRHLGDKRETHYNSAIDEYAVNNLICLIRQRYGELSGVEIIRLIVKRYGACAVSPLGTYWVYVRGENIPCDTLPFSVREIIENDESQIICESEIKWQSEYNLYKLVLTYYEDAVFHYTAPWLGNQHLDIYIPSIMVGIEYQGKQHYEPIDFFGGESGFLDRKLLDHNKKDLAKTHKVLLIEWPYTISVKPINLIASFMKNGINEFPVPDCFRMPLLLNNDCSTRFVARKIFEICRYSLEGKYIDCFSSYREASQICGIMEKQIQKAVGGYSKTAGGYQWRRCPENDKHGDIEPVKVTEQTNQSKPIYQVTIDGEVIAEFSSINSAVKQTGINRKSISCALNGMQKTAGGYCWLYSNN